MPAGKTMRFALPGKSAIGKSEHSSPGYVARGNE